MALQVCWQLPSSMDFNIHEIWYLWGVLEWTTLGYQGPTVFGEFKFPFLLNISFSTEV